MEEAISSELELSRRVLKHGFAVRDGDDGKVKLRTQAAEPGGEFGFVLDDEAFAEFGDVEGSDGTEDVIANEAGHSTGRILEDVEEEIAEDNGRGGAEVEDERELAARRHPIRAERCLEGPWDLVLDGSLGIRQIQKGRANDLPTNLLPKSHSIHCMVR